jgi:hypothetical protein
VPYQKQLRANVIACRINASVAVGFDLDVRSGSFHVCDDIHLFRCDANSGRPPGPASYSAVRKPDKTGDEGETQLQILEEINPLF